MKSGLKPNRPRHLNRDYIKSFHPQIYAGTANYPTFLPEFLTDDGRWMPDQNADGEPEGCTNYAQSNLALNLGEQTASPQELEAVTHANALGGLSIQMSLDAARKQLKWFTNTYQIHATGILDYFDAFRLAQASGGPLERRSISWGTPWFPSWEAFAQGNNFTINPDGSFTTSASTIKRIIMPPPSQAELDLLYTRPSAIPWHNSMLDGWLTIENTLVYRNKSWQGKNVGDNGFIYFPRDVINTVMTLKGTAAFTATDLEANAPQTIDISIVQKWLSYIRQWIGLPY